MRQVGLQLFGAFRDAEPEGTVTLAVEGTQIRELRSALDRHAAAHWPESARALIARSVFASATTILRDAEDMPEGEPLALLPPVSGG